MELYLSLSGHWNSLSLHHAVSPRIRASNFGNLHPLQLGNFCFRLLEFSIGIGTLLSLQELGTLVGFTIAAQPAAMPNRFDGPLKSINLQKILFATFL
jgi:hypothetical protein